MALPSASTATPTCSLPTYRPRLPLPSFLRLTSCAVVTPLPRPTLLALMYSVNLVESKESAAAALAGVPAVPVAPAVASVQLVTTPVATPPSRVGASAALFTLLPFTSVAVMVTSRLTSKVSPSSSAVKVTLLPFTVAVAAKPLTSWLPSASKAFLTSVASSSAVYFLSAAAVMVRVKSPIVISSVSLALASQDRVSRSRLKEALAAAVAGARSRVSSPRVVPLSGRRPAAEPVTVLPPWSNSPLSSLAPLKLADLEMRSISSSS